MRRLRTLLPGILAGTAALLCAPVHGATFTWGNATGNWATPASWVGNTAPLGTNPADILVFGGSVGTVGASTAYTATNNVATVPFRLNELRLTGTDADPINSGLAHTLSGNALRFVGTELEYAKIVQNGSANVIINTAINFSGGLEFQTPEGFAGTPGTVTINAGISGVGDIIKTGPSTFRFGTIQPAPGTPAASANTWMGNLILGDGTIRFNNNAQSASSALRANPVMFVGPATLSARRDRDDELLGYETSLRMGTLSSATGVGLVFAGVEGSPTASVSNYDVVITALTDGTFGGQLVLQKNLNAGNDGGDLVIRGVATQTFSGTLNIAKDALVNRGATMVLTDTASLATTLTGTGSVTMGGGTLVLDNTLFESGAIGGRLRDGTATSTTLETIGGGVVRLMGRQGTGTNVREETGRLQLGAFSNSAAESRPRSGHLRFEVVNQGALTELVFKSYSRDQTTAGFRQLATVEFGARNNSGPIALGSSAARIFLSADAVTFTPPTLNGLLSTTAGSASVGWATITTQDGSLHFATHGPTTGVIPVSTSVWSTSLLGSQNARLTGSGTTPNNGQPYAVNSIRMDAAGTLTIAGSDVLSSTAFLLAGGINYAITATGSGSISGNSTRFFHVQSGHLTVDAPLTGAQEPVVKAGAGVMSLTRNNAALDQVVAINEGAIRATPGSELPVGELRFRGGQLEIVGGGTFSRSVGYGTNTVNWSGVGLSGGFVAEVDEDRGSGGFAAFGADATIDLNAAGPSLLSWEDLGFVRSGHALTFGSPSATHHVTWTDNLSLSTANPAVYNYNAREIRVLDNSLTQNDRARITGTISGRQENDLLKTGTGDLEVAATNTYTGATIVHEGRLYVTGNSQTSFLHKVMANATLAGNGTVGNVLVESGGILAPGTANNIASVLNTKDIQLTDSNSMIRIDLGGTNAGLNGTNGFDQLNVTGSVTLNGASLQGSILGGFQPTNSDIFFILLNDGSDPIVGEFLEGSTVAFGGYTFEISYTANSANNQLTGGNDIALHHAIPEPSTFALLGLGFLAAARRRRSARLDFHAGLPLFRGSG